MPHQVLARKWRPRHFSEIVGQTHVVQALTNALQQQYLHHAYLFTGTRGIGKTTIARLLAKCLNCQTGITPIPCDQCECCVEINAGRFIDLFEIDAASRTKVEDTRDILENVPYAPTKGRFKIYLIDEVHMLSTHSFNALLKTLEEPPSHVKFILATTDPQKLPATVLSRCLQFHLLAMPAPQIATHLEHILAVENIAFESEAIQLLSLSAQGSMRDALSLLDQGIAYGNGTVLTTSMKTMLGTIDQQLLIEIITALKGKDGQKILQAVDRLTELGTDFNRALADLLSLLHQIAVQQIIPNNLNQQENANTASDNFSITALPTILELSQQLSPEEVQLYYQIGLTGQRDLPFAPSLRIGFEMTLLRMLAFMPAPAVLNMNSPSPKNEKIDRPVGNLSSPANVTTSVASAKSVSQSTIVQENLIASVSQSTAAAIIQENSIAPTLQSTITQESSIAPTLQSTITAKDLIAPISQSTITQENPSAPVTELQSTNDWHKLLTHLNLQGATLILAQHCELQHATDYHIQLRLHSKHKPLLQDKHIQRIAAALNEYSQKVRQVNIEIVSTDLETPANLAAQETTQLLQEAEQALNNDSFVQQLRQKFDATVIKDSITVLN